MEVWRTWKEGLRGRERRNNAVLIFSLETKANEKLFLYLWLLGRNFSKLPLWGLCPT